MPKPNGEDLLVAALRESESYRLLAQEALHRLHDLEGQLDRSREIVGALRDELRRYTRQQVGAREAA